MTLYDSVIVNLKGVIASRRDGVLLNNLNSEYSEMAGEDVPIRKLGYNSLQEFLNNHKDLFQIQGEGRFCRVINVLGKYENDTTLDLLTLVKNTDIKYKKKRHLEKPPIKYSSYKAGTKYTYQQNYPIGYSTNYQSNYHSNYLSNYRPNFQPNYQPNFQPVFKPDYNASVKTFGFNMNEKVRPAIEIYQPPNVTSRLPNGTQQSKDKPELLVPMKHLKNAHNSNVLIISDDEDEVAVCDNNVATQTQKILFKCSSRLFGNVSAMQFVNMIIDVIIHYKMLKQNEVLKIGINGDLYIHFCILTGFKVDPVAFFDFVLEAINSKNIQYLYKSLIYIDPTKQNCLFNVKSIFSNKMSLPDYDFGIRDEYVVEIVKVLHNNLIGFKILSKLNPNLNWKKKVYSEETKEIIESQQFWSWIPGTLCLVQLPYCVVKKLNVSSVERAIIMTSEVAKLINKSLQESHQYLMHTTSFYLIDHNLEVNNILSCATSYQEVKKSAKENNDSIVSFVCNMSICARNTPSKMQFAILENYSDVSSTFIDENRDLKLNIKIILKNIKKMTSVFNFQSLNSCLGRIYDEEERSLTNYSDIKVPKKVHSEVKDTLRRQEVKEVIVISDSDDEPPAKTKSSVAFENPFHSIPKVLSYCDKMKVPKPVSSVNSKEQVPLFKCPFITEESSVPISAMKALNVNDTTDKKSMKTNFISKKITFPAEEKKQKEESQFRINIKPITLFNKTVSKENHVLEKNPIVSYSESDDENESVNDLHVVSTVKKASSPEAEVSLSNSIISYMEMNSNSSRKCLRPLTTDIMDSFRGRIVKILQIQTGSAVLMLFDSVKLMKRDIKMKSLNKEFMKKAESFSVGDNFIWCQQNLHSDDIEYNFVEIVQVISKTSVLINKVHHGLLAVVNINDLFCLPIERNSDTQTLIGPLIGAFDLHIVPDWFTPDELFDVSNDLFTAFFVDGKLVLEYFEQPCQFLNIEIISSVEKSLTINHCNVKSKHFIDMLSKSLLQCRLFVGNVLEMIECSGGHFDQLQISKVLRKVSIGNPGEVCFASVLANRDSDVGGHEKLSPHNFMDDQFCIDRITFDCRRNMFRLMEHHNVFVEVPNNFEGVYRCEVGEVRGALVANEEFRTRYMLAGATRIPDLRVLHNKLIFHIRGF